MKVHILGGGPAASLLPQVMGGPEEWTSPQGLASTLQIIKALLYVGLNMCALRVWLKLRRGGRPRPFIEDRTFRPAVPSLHL